MNEQLDKILLDFACDVEDANKLGDDAIRYLNIKLREAKAKLQRLIVEARLDEVEKADSQYNEEAMPLYQYFSERTAKLEKEIEK